MFVRKAAVLGSNLMSAQIAAHFVNACIPVLLYDHHHNAEKSNKIEPLVKNQLQQIKPQALALTDFVDYIQEVNYEDHLSLLSDCDLIIDAIDEPLARKAILYQQLSSVLNKRAFIASCSSVQSVNKLAEFLTPVQRERFCGLHFFMPPRYVHLVELVPHRTSNLDLLNQIEGFLVTILGKGIVRAKDVPYLIANRIAIFNLLTIFNHMQKYGLTFEDVDYLASSKIGWVNLAIFHNLDAIGLDTIVSIINGMAEGLRDDPWAQCYVVPAWLQELLKKGAVGQKSGFGIYQKQDGVNQVWDITQSIYRPVKNVSDPGIAVLCEIESVSEQFNTMRYLDEPKMQFLWACYRDLFHYCAYHLDDITDTTRDVDLALRWGMGWKHGPFEIWQLVGWRKIAQWIEDDIAANKSLAKVSLPPWVAQCANAYQGQMAFSPTKNTYISRPSLPVYKRQVFPTILKSEVLNEGRTIFEDDDVRCWHMDDEIAILSFKSKYQVITPGVVAGLNRAIDVAEQGFKGLIVWQRTGDNFSYGADLHFFTDVLFKTPERGIEIIENFRRVCLRLRYSQVPTIAAIRGRVLGGACELTMYCSRVVAAFESYIGLVESVIGLSTASGGSQAFALRAQTINPIDPLSLLNVYAQQIINAYVTNNAIDALQKGYLDEDDVIVMNPNEILYVAKQQLTAIHEGGYQPPLPPMITALGKEVAGQLVAMLPTEKGRHLLSEHDYYVASRIIYMMCGGDYPAGTKLTEQTFLKLEGNLFLELASHPLTQERINRILNIKTATTTGAVRELTKSTNRPY
jgi:3-hydroxyacyl-CoA dehydrogenase